MLHASLMPIIRTNRNVPLIQTLSQVFNWSNQGRIVANLHTYSHWVKSSEVEESESQNKSIVLNLTIGSKNNTIKYNLSVGHLLNFHSCQWVSGFSSACISLLAGHPKIPGPYQATQSGSGSSTEKKYFYFLKARVGSHTSPKPVLSSAGAKVYSQTRAAIWVEPSEWKSLKISWTIPWKFRKILRRPKKKPSLNH